MEDGSIVGALEYRAGENGGLSNVTYVFIEGYPAPTMSDLLIYPNDPWPGLSWTDHFSHPYLDIARDKIKPPGGEPGGAVTLMISTYADATRHASTIMPPLPMRPSVVAVSQAADFGSNLRLE